MFQKFYYSIKTCILKKIKFSRCPLKYIQILNKKRCMRFDTFIWKQFVLIKKFIICIYKNHLSLPGSPSNPGSPMSPFSPFNPFIPYRPFSPRSPFWLKKIQSLCSIKKDTVHGFLNNIIKYWPVCTTTGFTFHSFWAW